MEEKNNKGFTKEEIAQMEEGAIIKYEKGAKPYRPAKYRPIPQQIKCAKCGAVHNLLKAEDKKTGNVFYFCKACVQQRANEIAREQRMKKEG